MFLMLRAGTGREPVAGSRVAMDSTRVVGSILLASVILYVIPSTASERSW
jgi:hypothetical protein